MTPSVLFARADSCYFDLVPDVWDEARDARCYSGPGPVIAHPPCRGWGRLRHFAKPAPHEKALALFAVDQVRRVGGVLEHPWGSTLWAAAGLPGPGFTDAWGGFTLLLDQGWWGHKAPKPTYLYVVGVPRDKVPAMPVQIHRAKGRTLMLDVAEREATPIEFARWLVDLASRVDRSLLQPPGHGTRCNSELVRPSAVTAVQARKRRASYIDLADTLIG